MKEGLLAKKEAGGKEPQLSKAARYAQGGIQQAEIMLMPS